MDVSSIASIATSMTTERTEAAFGIAVLKKAINLQAFTAKALIQALPPLPASRNINTTA